MEQQIKNCIEPDCKKEFVIKTSEIEFYAQKKLNLPKRCQDCRDRRKKESNSPFGQFARDMRNNGFKRSDN